MGPLRAILLAGLLSVAGLALAGEPGTPITRDWGLLRREGTDVDGRAWTQSFGPFWETRADAEGRVFRALRPLFAASADPVRDASQWEVLTPLAGGFRLRTMTYARVLLAWRKVFDTSRPDGPRYFQVFPFYFEGISRDGKPYRALFPLYGTLADFLARDEIRFWLFPLHVRSRVHEMRTTTWFWPFFSHSEGGGVRRWRFFPFYGETRVKDRSIKRFILWPFWTDVRHTLPGSRGRGFILWPLYGRIRMEDQRTTYFLPPLIRFSEGGGERRTNILWPFYQHATGSVEKTYFFPLWGAKTVGGHTSRFLLWPVGMSSRTETGEGVHERLHVNPFWHADDFTPDAPDGRKASVRELWPLFHHERADGRSLLRVPEFWPGREHPAVARTFTPLFSLFTRERNGGAVDTELLWGLYRSVVRPDGFRHRSVFPLWESRREPGSEGEVRRWSLGRGLVEREASPSGRSIRLLYFLRF